MTIKLSEQDLLASVKASVAIDAKADALDAMTQIAALYIEEGLTQEGADVLAYVMRSPFAAEDTRDRAHDLWDDLACWICPRVLVDAEDFGTKAHFEDVVEYVFAGT